jgi:hypothetical protein
VDFSTVGRWVVRFSSGNSDVRDGPCSGWLSAVLDVLEPRETVNSAELNCYITMLTKLKPLISREQDNLSPTI